jgi:uncharacterized protein (TIGR00369 family)
MDTEELDPLRPPSGFADLLGYRLTRWVENEAEVALAVEPRHLNRSGVLHGGVMATLIDAACGFAGCFIADRTRRRRAFTLALTTQFIGTVRAGDSVVCVARKTGGGRQVFFAAAEVLNQKGELVGRGDATYKYRGKSGEPEGDPAGPD